MNIKRLFYGILGCFLFLFPSLAGAYPTLSWSITDTYWGGAVQPNATYIAYGGEAIGSPSFSVDTMDVTKSGNNWTVVLTGEYFKDSLNPLIDSGYPSLLTPGDLYINSRGWSASGSGPDYATDTFTNLEGWDYVVTKSTQGWGLYSLIYNDIQMTNLSTIPSGAYIYREDQAWQQKRVDGNYIGLATRYGSATYNLGYDTLTFTFDTGLLDFSGDVGFHWTMQCGNDVVEGKVNVPVPTTGVPEPATMLLLGLGLVGVAAIRRKF